MIAYRHDGNSYGNEQYYLELRPINEKGKMEAAIPVSYEFMNMLTENYSINMTGMPYGKIPRTCFGAIPGEDMKNTSGIIRREEGGCFSGKA